MVSTKDKPLSVSALTQGLKEVIERGFAKLYVEAEISGWRPYPSGHVYFTLKDATAQISAVMFKSSYDRCKAKAALKDGAKVLVYANATVYAQRGAYQLVVLAAKPVGEGDLMQRYLELKAKLEAEGLFDPRRKRPLPFLPRRIGLVTSPAGAVIHDMCRVLMRRFPRIEIRFFPAVVQGVDAPASLVAGLAYFNGLVGSEWTPDLVIVGRGGGSFEDLFCFNDEALVRAVASARMPVISAVGHETDFTLCDFAADVRAGTPSMAAELAVPELRELTRKLVSARSSLTSALRGTYTCFAQRIDALGDGLSHALWRYEAGVRQRVDALAGRLQTVGLTLAGTCAAKRQTLARLEQAMTASLRLQLVQREARLTELSAKLSLLSPYSVLDRGYSLTTDDAGTVLREADAIAPGTVLHTRLQHGTLVSVAQGNVRWEKIAPQ